MRGGCAKRSSRRATPAHVGTRGHTARTGGVHVSGVGDAPSVSGRSADLDLRETGNCCAAEQPLDRLLVVLGELLLDKATFLEESV